MISNESIQYWADGLSEDEPLKHALLELLAHRKAREGWKIVPVEPTLEMLDSPKHHEVPAVYHDSAIARYRMMQRHSWRVMLAAAPEAK